MTNRQVPWGCDHKQRGMGVCLCKGWSTVRRPCPPADLLPRATLWGIRQRCGRYEKLECCKFVSVKWALDIYENVFFVEFLPTVVGVEAQCTCEGFGDAFDIRSINQSIKFL